MIPALFASVFIVLCLYAAVKDVETLTISNGLNAIIAFLFIPAVIITAPGWDVAGAHLLAGLAAFAISVLLFSLGVFGGGDAKLLAACAVWIGWMGLLKFLIFVALIGGVFALVLIVFRRLTLPESWTAKPWIRRLHDRKGGLPYGVAIGVGGILMVPELPLYAHAIRPSAVVLQGIQAFMA